MKTDSELVQFVSVIAAGFVVRLFWPVPQDPDPAPVALTSIVRFEFPSETVTVPPANDPEGTVRRIDTTFPLVEADTLALLETAEYVPEPPERKTCAELKQSLSVTVVGAAAKVAVGHLPSASPDKVTATFTTLVPSEMPMLPVAAAGPEGLRRRMVTVLPEIVATNASLPEATK